MGESGAVQDTIALSPGGHCHTGEDGVAALSGVEEEPTEAHTYCQEPQSGQLCSKY